MKKIVLTVVAMLSFTMAFAEEGNSNVAMPVKAASAYNMQVNMGRLADYLGLSLNQVYNFKKVHQTFCNEMLQAGAADQNQRQALISKAIDNDLKAVRNVLDDYQYRKYLMALNATFNNRGLEK